MRLQIGVTQVDRNNRKEILLIEFGSHLLGLQELARMLQPNWKLRFAIRYTNRVGSWRDEFTQFNRYSQSMMLHLEIPRIAFLVTKSRLLARLVGDSLLFGRVLSIIFRSHRVLIATGPEHGGLLVTFFIWIVILLRRERVILNVRDGRGYLRALKSDPRDAWSKLITSLFRRLKRITFEVDGVRDSFIGFLRSDSITGVIPWLMSDMALDPRKRTSDGTNNRNAPVSIGVLGTIDSSRRDYDTLVHALQHLSKNERKSLKLLFLTGPTPQSDIGQLRHQLSTLVEAEFPYEIGFLNDYITRGSTCDALLAPLKHEVGYGKTKGSGAFGDALAMRRCLVAPVFTDPTRAFSDFTRYYKDAPELAHVLKQMISEPKAHLSPPTAVYNRWTATSVYRRNIALFA